MLAAGLVVADAEPDQFADTAAGAGENGKEGAVALTAGGVTFAGLPRLGFLDVQVFASPGHVTDSTGMASSMGMRNSLKRR